MSKSQKLFAAGMFTAFVFLALGVLAIAQEQPGNPNNNWLNGKWHGTTYSGRPLEMDLRVMNDNEVKGNGVVRGVRVGERRTNVPATATGVVNGDKVTLDIFFTLSQETFKFHFTRADEKTLKLKRKNDEVDFNKVE